MNLSFSKLKDLLHESKLESMGNKIFHRTGLCRDYISLHEKGIFGSLELGRIEIATKRIKWLRDIKDLIRW